MATDRYNIQQRTVDKYIGRKYGLWTVLSYSHTPSQSRHHFTCRCDCGTVKTICIFEAAYGRSLSCGCIPKPQRRGIQQKTLEKHVGQKYGLWTVLSYSHTKGVNQHYFLCRCDCGTVKTVHIYEIKGGWSKSCGCFKRAIPNKLPAGEAAFNNLFGAYKRTAKISGRAFHLTKEEFRGLIFQDCFYCGMPPSRIRGDRRYTTGSIIYNGIDRVDNELGYTLDNCVTSCRPCNVRKKDITREMIYKAYHRLFNGN